MTRNLLWLGLLALLATSFAGCTTTQENSLVIAFTQTDDDLEASKNHELLADWIARETGMDVTIYPVPNSQAAIEAMRGGHADIGFFDGAAGWYAWQRFDFQTIAADVNSDGRDYYVASAWTLTDSAYDSMASLEGARSCHTGLLKSAGMFMPLGWLIGNDMVEVVGGKDDLASIQPTVEAYFSKASIPSDGPYSGYNGALRCLSEGEGDVAFIKDTTPASYCGEDAESWCLPLESYVKIQDFGRVPSHPVMVRPDFDSDAALDVQQALVALHASAEGQHILETVLETAKMVAVTSDSHLGEYGAALQHVPGIQTYVDSKLA